MTDPIQKLVEGTRANAAGKLQTRIAVKSSAELGMLAASFLNGVAQGIQKMPRQIRALLHGIPNNHCAAAA